MDEGRWAARVLSEISSARTSIAASYLALWRRAATVSPEDTADTADTSRSTGEEVESTGSSPDELPWDIGRR
jgi:hypothetical protein